ncbi:uncharacterized protein BJX67DRAFT_187128 [Aspergillus lucknowensis]|uniref:F-box domain-containing protein n=1 Tax=Aspergillus lucknowensis TaxID=176173 RepID=A0ABR4LLB7_9EURO
MTMDRLPSELLHMICLILDQSNLEGYSRWRPTYSLRPLCLTSRRLCAIAQPVIYRTIRLRTGEQYENLLNTFCTKPELAKAVTNVVFFEQERYAPRHRQVATRLKDQSAKHLAGDAVVSKALVDTYLCRLWTAVHKTQPHSAQAWDWYEGAARDAALNLVALLHFLPNVSLCKFVGRPLVNGPGPRRPSYSDLPRGEPTNATAFQEILSAISRALDDPVSHDLGGNPFAKIQRLYFMNLSFPLRGPMLRAATALPKMHALCLESVSNVEYFTPLPPTPLTSTIRELRMYVTKTPKIPDPPWTTALKAFDRLEIFHYDHFPSSFSSPDEFAATMAAIESQRESLREVSISIDLGTAWSGEYPKRHNISAYSWASYPELAVLKVPDILLYGDHRGPIDLNASPGLPRRIEALTLQNVWPTSKIDLLLEKIIPVTGQVPDLKQISVLSVESWRDSPPRSFDCTVNKLESHGITVKFCDF